METAHLVGLHIKRSGKTAASLDSLTELARLAETAGATVTGQTLQSLDKPNNATLIGEGKIAELCALAFQKKFDTLIFDEELKPAQQKNLAERIPVKILDRTRLILDIFAQRARTREGILQVELAQLSYMLPRITERYGTFEQQTGGIGTRGPGERKLEVEARHIRDRMSKLKRELESVKMHREIARERRHAIPLPVVAIVGYTNAGKSTLLNALVQTAGKSKEDVYADDKLFATLDPTTRRIALPSGRIALFTDTVGFIKKLPTHLIAAFRATLEETVDADLLLHVIDASDPQRDAHGKTVLEILNSLDDGPRKAADRMLSVYNKIDAVADKKGLKAAGAGGSAAGAALCVSATRKTGLGALLNAVEQRLSQRLIETEVYLPFDKMNLLSALYRFGKVEKVTHQARGMKVQIRLEPAHWSQLQKLLDLPANK